MSHPDEGTLHALLDGELDEPNAAEVDEHIRDCARCAARLDEARMFASEAIRLIDEVEPAVAREARPGASRPAEPRTSEPRTSEPRTSESPAGEPPIRPWAGDELPVEPRVFLPEPPLGSPRQAGEPIILFPENPSYQDRPQRGVKTLVLAAVLFLAAGIGYAWYDARRASTVATTEVTFAVPRSTASEAELTPKPPADSATNLGARTADRVLGSAPATAASAAGRRRDTAADTRDESSAPTRVSAAVPKPAPPKQTAQTAAPARAPASSPLRSPVPGAPTEGRSAGTLAASERSADSAGSPATPPAAAAPTVELAASAASAGDTVPPPAAPPPVAPPPESLQKQANIYRRAGLDEVFRQLGERLHALEGLRPEMVGLVQGEVVPGADPSRPVVRAVYVDALQRLIFLDQQRLRTGTPTGVRAGVTPSVSSANGQSRASWRRGDVWLSLHGRLDEETIRALAEQVR